MSTGPVYHLYHIIVYIFVHNLYSNCPLPSGVATPGPTRACARVKLTSALVKLMRITKGQRSRIAVCRLAVIKTAVHAFCFGCWQEEA